jgi:hypothetical protein
MNTESDVHGIYRLTAGFNFLRIGLTVVVK